MWVEEYIAVTYLHLPFYDVVELLPGGGGRKPTEVIEYLAARNAHSKVLRCTNEFGEICCISNWKWHITVSKKGEHGRRSPHSSCSTKMTTSPSFGVGTSPLLGHMPSQSRINFSLNWASSASFMTVLQGVTVGLQSHHLGPLRLPIFQTSGGAVLGCHWNSTWSRRQPPRNANPL